ncbi:MAG: hypothetical protein WDN31_03505 [Hyphomicrobium sp.]
MGIVRNFARSGALALLALSSVSIVAPRALAAEPLRISYADWPGYVAWQVAIEKNWFKEAGVDINFEWFDYSAAMEAFAAGKLDAINLTNGDTLGMGCQRRQGHHDHGDGLLQRQRHDRRQAGHQVHRRPEGKESRP